MFRPLPFIRRQLDPVDRLSEVLFGLIMALGFTGAVRLGHEEADNRTLFVAILGCNVAWGVVDGVMFVLTALFERSHRERLIRDVAGAPSDEAALARIGERFDERLAPFTTAAERGELYRSVLGSVRQRSPQRTRVQGRDVLGGLAVGLLVILATLPMLLPYLVVRNAELAVRLSHGIGVALIFLLGARWGKAVGAVPWRVGLGLAFVGSVLVAITIALGG